MKKLLFLLIFVLLACETADDVVREGTIEVPPPTVVVSVPVTEVVSDPIYPDDPVRQLTILYTNDEHGWMEGVREGLGAANLVGMWRNQFGYEPGLDSYLLLSGGDMWTGPAISTWFEGEGMVEVMNQMGYSAAAVGMPSRTRLARRRPTPESLGRRHRVRTSSRHERGPTGWHGRAAACDREVSTRAVQHVHWGRARHRLGYRERRAIATRWPRIASAGA